MPENNIPPVGTLPPEHKNPDTGASSPDRKIPLGVGVLFAETLSVLYSRFVPIAIIALPPTFFIPAIKDFLKGLLALHGSGGVRSEIIAFLLLIILPQILLYAATTAFVVQLTYDAKFERTINFRFYIRPAMASMLSLAVIGIFIGAILLASWIIFVESSIFTLQEFLFLFPASLLILIRIFAPIPIAVPAMVIEGSGFRGLVRSFRLTKTYRWAIAGLLFLAVLCLLLLLTVFIFLNALFGQIAGPGTSNILILAFGTLSIEFVGILTTLIYARLREIKEGVSLDRIDAVFE